MVRAGVFEGSVVYVTALVVAVLSRVGLDRYSRRVGAAVFRVVIWSLAAGLGLGSAYLLVVDTSGFSYGGFDALLSISALATVPAFVIVALVVVVLGVFFRRGFEELERAPLVTVTVALFVVGVMSGFTMIR